MNSFHQSIIRACKSNKPDRFLAKIYAKNYMAGSDKDMKQCINGAMFIIVNEYNLCSTQSYRDNLYAYSYYYYGFTVFFRDLIDSEYEALKSIIRYTEAKHIPNYIPAKKFRKKVA